MIFTKRKSKTVSSFKAGDDGKYVFMGAHFAFSGDYARFRALLVTLSAAIAVLWVGGGFIPAPGMMNGFYVIIPYFAATLVSAALTVWAALRAVFYGERLRDYVYETTVKALPARAVATVVCAAISAVCEIVYLIINGTDGFVWTALSCAVLAAISACALLLRKTAKTSVWKKE